MDRSWRAQTPERVRDGARKGQIGVELHGLARELLCLVEGAGVEKSLSTGLDQAALYDVASMAWEQA